MTNKEDGIELKCGHCSYKWTYAGKYKDAKKKYYATCPRCKYQVNIKKAMVD